MEQQSGKTAGGTKLLDQLRRAIRLRHYSLRTEQAYVYWCRFYIRYHRLRHPREMGEQEVAQFLSYLALERKVALPVSARARPAARKAWRGRPSQTSPAHPRGVHA